MKPVLINGVYPFTGLEHWNGLLEWNTGIAFFITYTLLPPFESDEQNSIQVKASV